jgi:Arc/MetJ-type ribon-helix-helix transcriptional regulator
MADDPQTTTVQAEVPTQLLAELKALVDAGWFRDLDEVILDALRRFVESHPAELMEVFLREDVEWGLRGRD